MTTILFKKHELEHTYEYYVYFADKMDEVRTMNKIEVELYQEKIDL